MSDQEQVDAYARLFPSYQAFSGKVRGLLEDLLTAKGISYQVVEGRPKSIEGFREKISRPGKSYSNAFDQIPDLCGCRIIVYYLDDVEKSSEIIKDEFEVVEEELSHQPSALQADRFGYLSAHYIVRLGAQRNNLPEWVSFSGLKAEIQIRTVIQHAWSAVSHALQYKAEVEVPSALQRRLYRIAGLFELADEEFRAIRNERSAIREAATEALTTGDLSIPLSVSSIEEFARSWSKMRGIVADAEHYGFDVTEYQDDDTVGNIYDLAERAGVKTIAGLEAQIAGQSRFLKRVFDSQDEPTVWNVSRNFLVYLLLIGSQKNHISLEYLVKRGWSESIATIVLEA